jgi:benzoate/toluate 1,2-dioxygenase alpha subunit
VTAFVPLPPLTRANLSGLIDDRAGEGIFRVNRRVFTDPQIFDLEMKHLFESGWVFLGLESQLRNRHDFFAARIGRIPVLVTRGADDRLHAFVNSCPHKGARVCQLQKGNARVHVCPYHSWSFDSSGKNMAIKDRSGGHYAAAFDQDSHGLPTLAMLGNYRGFLFGSLTSEVLPIEEHLGEAARLLDLIVDQSPQGIELVPGSVTFTFEANWKLQLENCSDQYHFTSVHPSYLTLLDHRAEGQWAKATRNVFDPNSDRDVGEVLGGSYTFPNGHVLNWRRAGAPDALPLFERNDELAGRVGEARRDWMLRSRNLTIFPSVQFADNASSQLRIIQPISVNRTEMRTFCVAPVGESKEARRIRIRQYEDFFNPSGLATPDDAVVYEACQEGFASEQMPWLQGYSRGLAREFGQTNEYAEAIGMTPAHSALGDPSLGDETIFHAYYRTWLERLASALPEAVSADQGAPA